MTLFVERFEAFLMALPELFGQISQEYVDFYISLVRHACPLLAFLLLLRCALPLLSEIRFSRPPCAARKRRSGPGW